MSKYSATATVSSWKKNDLIPPALINSRHIFNSGPSQ
jgi:hypothetical protein